MAQVYAVVYEENGCVLMAFKKAKGAYFHGEKTTPTTLNSAGQLVVPGGGLEFGESIADGSRREFLEETGVGEVKGVEVKGVGDKCVPFALSTPSAMSQNCYPHASERTRYAPEAKDVFAGCSLSCDPERQQQGCLLFRGRGLPLLS
ncbi:MAG: NUDIX domain-containing protein [Gammaproteobacteria bacterium]|nr:NUDIX domain-containing protein [Gammaproteobacteria bacterium]